MVRAHNKIRVYLEIGKTRTFAGAIDWPGWCRSGHDENSALQTLCDYGPRYAQALGAARLGFEAPADVTAFDVVERLDGDATTDFGAPGVAPASDKRPVDDADLVRFRALLRACWHTFDAAVSAAAAKELRKGPRGGGRDLGTIVQHVLGSEAAYLGRIGRKIEQGKPDDPRKELAQARKAIVSAFASTAGDEGPAQGRRGGARWTRRYLARRVAWHILDHAWEIEDRAL